MLKTIGRYEVICEIGRGGMSTVFKAFDPEFEREVAIKVLPREFLYDPQFRVRFEREAKSVAALEHFAIVPLYDLGEADGQPYIVARLMAGGTLADRVNQGPLSVNDAASILSRVASALDAAHARGIVHRDLKPSNILLDKYNSIFLSDFGIARLPKKDGFTLTGSAIIGSPPYMSPEQIQGETDIDGRSDVYAMGVILFEMLTGRVPYQTDSPTQTIMAHLLEPVPSVRDFNPDISQKCEDVIKRAMSKNKGDRYRTAGEMAVAMQAAVYGEIHGVPLFPPGDTISISRSSIVTHQSSPLKKWLYIIVALLGLILIVGTSIFFPHILQSFIPSPTTLKAPIAITEVTLTPAVKGTPSPTTKLTPVISTKTSSLAKTNMPVIITPFKTQSPTAVATENRVATLPIAGGADKVAFFKDNDIWVMNIDGGDLKQISFDGGKKFNLRWMDDGEYLKFITANCAVSMNINITEIKKLFCLGSDDQINIFEISPDQKTLALGINRKLYILPYNLENLKRIRYRSDIQDMDVCKYLIPYNLDDLVVENARWVNDNSLAIIVVGNAAQSTIPWNTIQVLDTSTCQNNLPVTAQFPIILGENYQVLAEQFPIREFKNNPIIQNFSSRVGGTYTLTGYLRNEGYGDLYVYDQNTNQVEAEINPIDKACCYRDVQWSPDGKFMFFTFQDERKGVDARTEFYYIPHATIGIGLKYKPVALPVGFFSNPLDKPYPILRSAMEQK